MELIVAVAANIVPDGTFAVSKASSIHPYISFPVAGTHKVLPLLAIIWRRILVAMLCRFFFLRVASVITCVMSSFFSVVFFSFL